MAFVVLSPARQTSPVVSNVSQATRAYGSCASMASRMQSEIWSAILSGWPIETDSLVKRYWSWFGTEASLLPDWSKVSIDHRPGPAASILVRFPSGAGQGPQPRAGLFSLKTHGDGDPSTEAITA